jgi:hypothetical protein
MKSTVSIHNQEIQTESLEETIMYAKQLFEEYKYVDVRFHGEKEIILSINTFVNIKKEERIFVSAYVREMKDEIYEEFITEFNFNDNLINWILSHT